MRHAHDSAETEIWKSKYFSQVEYSDSLESINKDQGELLTTVVANYKRDMKWKSRWQKAKDIALYVIIPVVIAETTYLVIKK